MTAVTLQDLISNTMKFDKNRLIYTPDIKVSIKSMIPFLRSKFLFINAIALSGTDPKKKYNLSMAFYKLDFITDLDKPGIKVTYDNSTVVLPPIYKDTTPVRVRCQCHDYYFTWGWWNHNQGASYGPRQKPYVRKTTTYPERNPAEYPGLCKHLLNMVSLLKDEGILK